MPVWPLLFQSPTTGVQPGSPYWKGGMLGAPALLLLRKYQVMVAGSTTPTVTRPSPSQSPTTGIQPTPPYWNCPPVGAPAELPFRRYHVPVAGSNWPGVRAASVAAAV